MAHFDSLREEFDGELACTIELHLEVPVFRICYSVGRHDYEFEICEKDGKIIYDYSELPELKWYQSLFV